MNLSDNALKVLEKRYLVRNVEGKLTENAEGLFHRVAKTIAAADAGSVKPALLERIEEDFYEMISNLEFLPNSPTLMNAGRPLGQLSACFVLPVEDTMEGIFESIKNAALIHKSGGGTGFSFSRLRGKGSAVNSTGGVASGPVSFMKVFNAATEAVKQGGTRRGANMGILRVDHPDIKEYITCKQDNADITNFNISIGITEEFMNAVEKSEDYNLIDPRSKKAVGRESAKAIFDMIVNNAWNNGEPGIIFLDRLNKDNVTPALGEIESTNPCVTGDTWILTQDGPAQVSEILGKETRLAIDGIFYETAKEGFFRTGFKEVIRVETERGYNITLTKDHLVRVASAIDRFSRMDEWKKAGDLREGDLLIISNNRGLKWAGKGSFEEGYLLGMLIGDGTLKKDGAVISVWGRDEEAQSLVNAATGCAAALPHRSDFTGFQKMIEAREEQRMKMAALRDVAAGYGITPGNKVITAEIEKTGYDFHRGFLRGIFDTDGTVIGNHEKGVSVRLWQKDMSSMVSVQRMLQRLGIASVIYGNRKNSGVSNLPDGKGGSKSYNVSAGHELVISGDNIAFYHEVVGFASSKKQVRLNQVLNKYKRAINRERYTACVTAVKEATTCDVYDVQIPGKNAFDANGIYVHNCGEQPLLPYEACNLGSINLDLMLKEENGTVEVDYEKLKQTVRKAVHFLDNVIEVNKYPLPEIDKMTKGTRKIGLGVMAWADMLCKLGIPYNSQAAVDLAENVMGFIQDESHKMSTEMAKKKGVFPYFDQSVFKGKGISFRNATTTTIAPTGTLSIIAGVSSGIEPIFAISYIRNVMDNDELVEVNSLFKKIAVEGGFYSDDLMKRIAKKGSIKGFDEIPQKWQKIFATSHDISPEWHVKMQSAFQKYTDNAVSKTVNLCHDATKDDVRDVFLLAFRTGCKGVTIYRDGSRDMQVLNIGKVKGKEGGSKESAGTVGHTATGESGKIIAGDAIDSSGKASMAEAAAAAGNYHPNVVNGRIIPRSRPDITTGFTEKVKIGCGNLYITVNCDENGICEVFTNTGRAGGCPSQSEATSRLVSIALRSGMDAKSIVEQLKGIRCPSTTRQKDLKVLSCPDAIGRLIEKVMKLQTGKENGKDGLNGNGHDNIGHLSTLNGHGTTGHSSSVNSSSSTIPSSSPSSGFSSNSSSGYSSGTGTGSGSGSGAGSVGLAGNIGSSSSGSGLIVGSRSNIGSNGSSGSCSDGGSGSNGSSNSNGGNGSNAIIGSSCSSISSGYGNINGSAAFSGNVAAGVTSANVRTANINPIGYVKKEVNYPRPTAKCLKECQECSMRDFCNNPDRDADMVEETEMDEIFSEVIASESSSKGETVYDLLNLLKDCPDCGSKLEHEGGCVICRNCGFSKCG